MPILFFGPRGGSTGEREGGNVIAGPVIGWSGVQGRPELL